ncbi:N/A [soil metagenome]
MNHGPIHVEIVTPVHNRKPVTLKCLKSLTRINRDGLRVGIIIVDDGSTDGTGSAIREQYPDVDVIKGGGNLWFTEGTNVGVRRALERNPKYVLMINDDQVFDEDFLVHMVATAERNARSVVGSLLLLWDTPHKLFQVSPQWSTLLGGWRHWQGQSVWTVPSKPWKVDIIVGNCVLVPAEAFRECGLMNSERYPNFGDAEFTPRLKKSGWELLIDPKARVFCMPNTLPRRIGEFTVRQKINVLLFDLGSSQNLRRRLYADLDGAPSKFKGLLAFVIFLFRAAIGRNVESEEWGRLNPEKPLSETFASAVIDE